MKGFIQRLIIVVGLSIVTYYTHRIKHQLTKGYTNYMAYIVSNTNSIPYKY